ncbi:MAG: carboxypeptidase-like regulatory domain-containing protein [Salinimicrobium sp.]
MSGTVVDNSSKENIAFATVQIGESHGVVTNQEGDFSINISNFFENDSLVFSSMGYERKSISLKDYEGGVVYLQENLNELKEVVLVDKNLTGKEIMLRVNQNRYQNYDSSLAGFTVFHRSENKNTPGKVAFRIKKADFIDRTNLREFNKSIDSIAKSAKGVTSSFYDAYLAEVVRNEKGHFKTRIKKATELVNEEKSNSMEVLLSDVAEQVGKKLRTSNTFKVRTGIIPVGDSIDLSESFKEPNDSLKTNYVQGQISHVLKDSLFDARGGMTIAIGGGSETGLVFDYVTNVDDYEYTVDDLTSFNGDLVYRISFKPDSGFFGGGGKYTGKIFVSADSYAVLKTEYRLAKGEHGAKFNLKFLLGVKFVENERKGMIIFEKKEDGKYAPKYVQSSGKSYAYAKRSFVLKENGKSRSERMKLKFDFTMEFDTAYNSEFLLIDSKSISAKDYSEFKGNKGVLVEKTTTYNPQDWKEYNVLAPTEAIRTYEF